eukprot:5015540-Alexandrium_andersonii.AAC.1
MSDGGESTYTFEVPDTDNASSASAHASRASSTSEWVQVPPGSTEVRPGTVRSSDTLQKPKKQAK